MVRYKYQTSLSMSNTLKDDMVFMRENIQSMKVT
jgi:hypothetical protein